MRPSFSITCLGDDDKEYEAMRLAVKAARRRRDGLTFWLAAIASAVFAGLLPGCGPTPVARAAERRVDVVATPNGGIQPQAVVDARGTVHLIYFKGNPMAGDLFYLRRAPGSADFSAPVRVNSHPGSAMAMGTIRGGQIALGQNGRVHVAWNGASDGSGDSQHHQHPSHPGAHEGEHASDHAGHPGSSQAPGGGAPLLYARLNDSGTAFEPERNLMRTSYSLDGGGSIAAEGAANVYAIWHAAPSPGAGEETRRVYVARSTDSGKIFSTEAPFSSPGTGACGCCGLKVFAAHDGTLYILYRAATRKVERGMQLLVSRDHGRTFQARALDRWPVDT
jgi:hypothetical protein